MIKLDSFEPLFGSWFDFFKPFLQTKAFEDIFIDLKSRANRGKIIFPYSSTLQKKCPKWKGSNTMFRCFKETDISSLKVVFVGLSPYYTIVDGKPIADGLAFSTYSKPLPPSLEAFYNGVEADVYNGLNLNMERSPSLQFLAKQGVLLMNSALTCEPQMPTVHTELWQPFMEYFFKKLNNTFSNLDIVFFGEEAQQYAKFIAEQTNLEFPFPNQHYIYKIAHPSFYARSAEIMKTNIFSQLTKKHGIYWDTIESQPPF